MGGTAIASADQALAVPTGTIVFRSNRNGQSGIWIMNADGSDSRLVIGHDQVPSNPALSPDGSRIAYASGKLGNRRLVTVGIDGSNPVAITDGTGDEHYPSWSPDGSQIVFARRLHGQQQSVWIVDATGQNLHALTDGLVHWDADPDWSNGGPRIVFRRDFDIWTINADGSNLQPVVQDAATDEAPAWSPNDSQILFRGDGTADGNFEIWVVDANGSGLTDLTNDPGYDRQPLWSPDGTMIAFTSDRSGRNGVWRARADGSNPVMVTTGGASNDMPDWGPSFASGGTVSDTGFSLGSISAPAGAVVEWTFASQTIPPTDHQVTDASGLGLFDSGPEPPGKTYGYLFMAAGGYTVVDPTTGATMTVNVEILQSRRSIGLGDGVDLAWGTQAPPTGQGFDVQVKVPGGTYQSWLAGTTLTQERYVPGTTGTYLFRARLIEFGVPARTKWSPAKKVVVSP
jgi:Tol biopolymer transport system component